MLSLWTCFISNSRKAQVFLAFLIIMLALISIEYLIFTVPEQITHSLDEKSNSSTTPENLSDTQENLINFLYSKKSVCLNRFKRFVENERLNNVYDMFEAITKAKKPPCMTPKNLGPTEANKTKVTLSEVDHKYPNVSWGGWYLPPNCDAKYNVAIIIPYRNRLDDLAIFINNIHPFMKAQHFIEYAIFVIEQCDNAPFNRGKLLNIGFLESIQFRKGGWSCFIFHDVDLLPLNTKNLYRCGHMPIHMAAAIDIYSFEINRRNIFGGVVSMSIDHMMTVNGYSNLFSGFSGEDIDLCYRFRQRGLDIKRYDLNIARYTMLPHKKIELNDDRFKLIRTGTKNSKKDGLNTVNYKILNTCQNHLFTHILVKTDLALHDTDILNLSSEEDSQ